MLQETTEKYIICESVAKQLQDGLDCLTEQVRLYAMTGQAIADALYKKGYQLYFYKNETSKKEIDVIIQQDENSLSCTINRAVFHILL